MEVLHSLLRRKFLGSWVRKFSHGKHEEQQGELMCFEGVLFGGGVTVIERQEDILLEILFDYRRVPGQSSAVSTYDLRRGGGAVRETDSHPGSILEVKRSQFLGLSCLGHGFDDLSADLL